MELSFFGQEEKETWKAEWSKNRSVLFKPSLILPKEFLVWNPTNQGGCFCANPFLHSGRDDPVGTGVTFERIFLSLDLDVANIFESFYVLSLFSQYTLSASQG